MPETIVARGKRRRCGMTSGMCCIRTTLISFNLGTGVSIYVLIFYFYADSSRMLTLVLVECIQTFSLTDHLES